MVAVAQGNPEGALRLHSRIRGSVTVIVVVVSVNVIAIFRQ